MSETTSNPKDTRRALPTGWRWMRLGEVCEFLDSRRVPVNDVERQHRIAGKSQSTLYPYYGANGQVGWIDGYLFDEPLILLAEDGGFFGSRDRAIAYKIEGKAWVNNHAHVLRPNCDVDLDFCLHSLAIRPDVGQMVTGNTRPKLNQEIAAQIPLALPPLAEQKRIAAILNEQMVALERARAATEAQLEAAKALSAAYLQLVFRSDAAQNWPKRGLSDLCALLPAKSISTYGDCDVAAVTTACLSESGFDPTGVKPARMRSTDAARCIVGDGEILVARSNTQELVGRVSMFAGEPKGVVASDLTIRLLRKGEMSSEFLCAFMSFLYVTGYWRSRAGGASGSMKKITRSQIQSLEVPIPPTAEQEQVACRLKNWMTSAERLRRALEDQLTEINALPVAILRRAFSGAI